MISWLGPGLWARCQVRTLGVRGGFFAVSLRFLCGFSSDESACLSHRISAVVDHQFLMQLVGAGFSVDGGRWTVGAERTERWIVGGE